MSFSKSTSITLFILILLLLAGLTTVGISAISEKSTLDSKNNHALIIGINQYDKWPDLKSPVKDAEAIQKVLIGKYNFKKSNITLLTDNTKQKPTLTNILNSLGEYSDELTEKDNLLIFFSGHSKEENDGETYWIPKNGKKKTKLTWLKHSAISEEFFASEDFKAKSLCIITDSPFLNKLFRSRPISLSPFDLRYTEKIIEKSTLRSREVISFGDNHWPGSKSTNGLGLFAYYIHKALLENTLDVIDFENLIFDENILFPISKIAGTKMLRGRFRTSMDAGGQFIIQKLAPIPVVNIVEAGVTPPKGYPGDRFDIRAKTSAPASEVFIEIAGKRIRMKGSGTDWQFSTKVDDVGDTPFRIAALNERDIQGKPKAGQIITIRRSATIANIRSTEVKPASGVQGGNYQFAATTDTPASKVDLLIKGKRFKMKGSGTRWTLSKRIEDLGTIDFSVVATNEDGVQGTTSDGKVRVKAATVDILEARASPETGYAGEEFTITARTNRAAAAVSIQLDGETYAMEGSGKSWRFKKAIPDIGKKQFSVIAKNVEGVQGKSKQGVLLTKRSPLPIPNVAVVDVNVVSPGQGHAGDSYTFKVQTTAPSEGVFVSINDKIYPMQGSGIDWSYIAKIDQLGDSKYQVIAKNKDGVQGASRDGVITTTKKPLERVNVLTAAVSPAKGFAGKDFTFKANTDRPAKGVALIIGKNRYEMSGSGTDWQFSRKIDQTGNINFSIIARNEDEVEGAVKVAALTVVKELKGYKYNKDGTVTNRKTGKVTKRFVDNGNGTISDLLTNLMWMKQPKTIAVSYEQAVAYCRDLEFQGQTGWRLPTIAEWRKFVDKKQRNPSLPPGSPFTNILTHIGYWSKSRHKFGPQYVYQMNLWYGKVGHIKKKENSVVWPVRYAELSKEG